MTKDKIHPRFGEAVDLLKKLIAVPSFSKEEDGTAQLLMDSLQGCGPERLLNNVWAVNKFADKNLPTVLLNSHHDTVRPNAGFTNNPFGPKIKEGKLFGLGSTDAGAALVDLLFTFLHFYPVKGLPYNIVFAAAAEEEISGRNGIEKLFADTAFKQWFRHPASFAIVGEPTQLELAITEKGLMVLDCTAMGYAGHAARNEGDNAIYRAVDAIEWFRNYRFERVSPTLGEMKMSVTSIETENKAHNLVPASCSFVVDLRLTDAYPHDEVLDIVRQHVQVQVKPRSKRLGPSSIAEDHPIVVAGKSLGKKVFGSPTTSDRALIPLPSLKCGPGHSAQSHSANEFVLIDDVKNGLRFYISLLEVLFGGPPS